MHSESGGPVRQVDNFGKCLLVFIIERSLVEKLPIYERNRSVKE